MTQSILYGSQPLTIMLSALAFIFLSTLQCTTLGTYVSRDTQQPMQLDNVKVPVILGVMSACPDALICESVFDRVLKKVADKTDLALTYIAQSVFSPSLPPAPAQTDIATYRRAARTRLSPTSA